MIRRELTIAGRPSWLLITQQQHAELAWRIANARQSLKCEAAVHDQYLYAVRRHDDGWADVDEEIARDETGSPIAFYEFVPRYSVNPWRNGVLAAARGGRFAQWLVAAHFLALGAASSRDFASPELSKFLDEERVRQPARLEGVDPILADELLRQLQLVDAASLACCGAFGRSRETVGENDAAVTLTRTAETWTEATATLTSHWEWNSVSRPILEPIAWSCPATIDPTDRTAAMHCRTIRWALSLAPSDRAAGQG